MLLEFIGSNPNVTERWLEFSLIIGCSDSMTRLEGMKVLVVNCCGEISHIVRFIVEVYYISC